MIETIKNLFNRELTEEEKVKYNIANFKQKVEEVKYEKPNELEKLLKTIKEFLN